MGLPQKTVIVLDALRKPLRYDDFDVNHVTEVELKPNAKQNELSAAIF